MLRASTLSHRALRATLFGTRSQAQWFGVQRQVSLVPARNIADTKKPSGSKTTDNVVFPGSERSTVGDSMPPGPNFAPKMTTGPITPATPASDSTIPPESVPLVPPSPPPTKQQTAPPSSIPPTGASQSVAAPPAPPPPSPPSPVIKRRSRRFRNLIYTLLLLSGLGYAGGVYYSLISDNFHDFFTEYIPFGEDCVLYFEEREFRRRFPNATTRYASREEVSKVTIPSKSGISWKVAESKPERSGSDLQKKGPHMSAVTESKESKAAEPTANVQNAKSEIPTPGVKPIENQAPAEAKPASKVQAKPETSPAAPIKPIDPISMSNADEPLVQDLTKILNNIITVINADSAGPRFNSAVESAKTELASIGKRVVSLKEGVKKEAEEKIRSTHEEFDRAAKELVKRLQEQMRTQEVAWKEEFETEREKISQSYQEKLKTEVERTQQLAEQRLHNQLVEQAIELKRQFMAEVRERVESERHGRLGRLEELSSSVSDLEKLTADWNSVIDANLKTQHLVVAVDTVRSNLEKATQPRPFVRELAALKEISEDDPVVNAAIASMNPTAYQRGIPTSAQLIDRFRRVADEVRKASLLPEDAGVASHAASLVLSKLLFKKKGLAVGDDVESILTRAETLLEEGNLDAAAREVNSLQGWAKTLSRDWLGEVRKVLEVQQALDVIATEARLQSLRVD